MNLGKLVTNQLRKQTENRGAQLTLTIFAESRALYLQSLFFDFVHIWYNILPLIYGFWDIREQWLGIGYQNMCICDNMTKIQWSSERNVMVLVYI